MSRLGSEFDDFLFAPIGEDRNGMRLSVLSALARQDVDPWQAAAELAGLPPDAATQRLASLIGELPDEPSAHLGPGTIAARLIALLPHPAHSNIPSRETLFGGGEAASFRAGLYMCMVFIVFTMAAQWIVTNGQPSADNGDAPASSTVSPPLPPPNSGQ